MSLRYGMCKFQYGITYYGTWKSYDAHGEGAVIDKDGVTIVEGDFVDGWIKYKGKFQPLI